MKIRYIVVIILAAVAFFVLGRMTAENHTALNAKTAENLSSAMHGEAFAFAKYSLYAQQAREHGNEELAKLFDETARTERMEHFAEEAKLAGLVGSDEANLRDSIKGETWETEHMYPEFASHAKEAGDAAAATRFQEISTDEARHRDAFQSTLDKLQAKAPRAESGSNRAD
jgi:rubrerythrin